MPGWAVREMVADWMGTQKSHVVPTPKTLDEFDWHHEERPNMRFHPDTEAILERVLSELFAPSDDGEVPS
jgi:hypothetical protein